MGAENIQYGNSNYVYFLVRNSILCTSLCQKYLQCLKKIGINRNVAFLLQNSVRIQEFTPVKEVVFIQGFVKYGLKF